MDRLNHVKIVTPDPEAVDRFLREVVDIPEGWSLGPVSDPPAEFPTPARDDDGNFTMESIMEFRGAGTGGGMIVGNPDSRQFQVFQADTPRVWGVAIGTRDLEGAHERCVAAGYPCTEPQLTAWGDAGIRFFFADVGGIVFEVMRAEASGT
jgi:hypothetical protein